MAHRSGGAGDTAFRARTGFLLLRSTALAVVMVVAYYLAPLDHSLDLRVTPWLLAGLLLLWTGLARQIRAIKQSEHPRLRAIHTVAVGLPLLLLLYAWAYYLVSLEQPGSFTEPLDRNDALYFALIVFTTVGFGDITPVTTATRALTMTQMVVNLLVLGVVARALLKAVRVGTAHHPHQVARRGPGSRSPGPRPS